MTSKLLPHLYRCIFICLPPCHPLLLRHLHVFHSIDSIAESLCTPPSLFPSPLSLTWQRRSPRRSVTAFCVSFARIYVYLSLLSSCRSVDLSVSVSISASSVSVSVSLSLFVPLPLFLFLALASGVALVMSRWLSVSLSLCLASSFPHRLSIPVVFVSVSVPLLVHLRVPL